MLVHGSVALLLLGLPSSTELTAPSRPPYLIDLEPSGPGMGAGGTPGRGRMTSEADRALPGGARPPQNIDAQNRGEGGDAQGDPDAILLLHRADGVVLFDSPLNNLAAAQSQRIRTASDRATLERRRATPNPGDAAFLASGTGRHQERRPVSELETAPGARRAPPASVEGARPAQEQRGTMAGVLVQGSSTRETAAPRRSGASDAPRGSEPSPGVGILDGRGARRTQAAPVDHARPPVDRGRAATQADAIDRRIRDRDDAELLARSMMQSWVESTTRSGPRAGPGRGGVGGGGHAGSGGGRGEGGRARAYGPGDGSFDALDTSDARYRRWFVASRRRVHDALRFPRKRALAMDQGISIYSIQVRRDGSLAAPPRLVRSSGFEDLDRAALAAIHQATPFAPLPDDLAPERDSLRIRLPIEFSNPMVR